MVNRWVKVSDSEASLRKRIAEALTESATDFGAGDLIAANTSALVDAVLGVLDSAPRVDRAALLLELIQADSGPWTGQRAERALSERYGWDLTSERAVQFMLKLVERGQLVIVNPPRGRTFALPFGPGGQTRTEWANVLHDQRDPDLLDVVSERLARERMRFPWHTALLRREVRYGPWVEVEP